MQTLQKRGQGLPLNTIIISIIVVVVLVVIILIFTGNIGQTNTTLRSCAAQGGVCDYANAGDCTAAEGRVVEGTCSSGICCVVV